MEKTSEEKLGSAETLEGFFREIELEFLIHEMKDPLSVIETGVRSLLERPQKSGVLSPRQEKTLRRVLRNARKAREMLYGMLEVGRSEAGCFLCEPFEPVEAVREALDGALETTAWKVFEAVRRCRGEEETRDEMRRCGIVMHVDASATEALMTQDRVKFRQILGNLFKNALHHRKERVEISVRRERDHLVIDVSDDGPGVDPEHHQLIFRRYAQAGQCLDVERKGHGLGLAGGLIMARCLGGDIEIYSRKGRGATFRLRLPYTMERPFAHDSEVAM